MVCSTINPGNILNLVEKRLKYYLMAVVLLFFLGTSSALGGTTINVSSGNVADLIQAINDANSEVAPFDGADTIILDGSIFTLTEVDNTFNVNNGLPVITSEITIEGNGSTIERDNTAPDFRILAIDGDGAGDNGNLTLKDTTISGGRINDGGGIFNYFGEVDITRTTITENNSLGGNGAGIYNTSGTVVISNSSITNNDLDTTGDRGCGIYNGGTLLVKHSTISGNACAEAGGIFNNNSATIINSTVSNNEANATDAGGGIYNTTSNGTFTIINTTITNNEANNTDSVGGILISLGSTITIKNSIVSGNSGALSDEIFNPNGTINADSFNLFGHSGITNDDAFLSFTPGTNDITATSDGTDPTALSDILDTTLAGNGGLTDTHALVTGSPAIDGVPDGSCLDQDDNTLNNDQRNFLRPVDGDSSAGALCDIGSFELQDTAVVNVTKETVPTGGTGFYFDIENSSGGIFSAFSLDHGETESGIISPLDTVKVTEQIPDNFEASIDCSTSSNIDSSISTDNNLGTVSASLDTTSDVLECTFTNTLLCDVNVNVTGDGQGTVTDNNSLGINCSEGNTGTCSAEVAFGTVNIDFSVSADSGSIFTGFSGNCDSNGTIASVGDGDDINGCSDTCTAEFLTDSDGDGTPDTTDQCEEDPDKTDPGICGCGVADTDSDGDGTADCNDTCPDDPEKTDPGQCGCGVADTDSDGDGTADCNDMCPDDAGKTMPGACGCGVADTDTDGDGIADCNDECINDAENDEDGDGICGDVDNCPAVANPDQADNDEDGIGDACDTDDDNDGVDDEEDNCPFTANPVQEDSDFDGIGDVCDDSDDTDTLIRFEETSSGFVSVLSGNFPFGGEILVELPENLMVEFAEMSPDVGSAQIVRTEDNTRVENPDVIFTIDEFPPDLKLFLDLCRTDNSLGTAQSEVEVVVEEFSDQQFATSVDLQLGQVQPCRTNGNLSTDADNNNGCNLLTGHANKSSLISNFFVTSLPIILGIFGLFIRRKTSWIKKS